ncbi:MAG: hypothetical protein J0L82_05055 [Deltaproteobacteria bacterium]|nr:hypothetical protein [Deltaproteobacteria bacterium]
MLQLQKNADQFNNIKLSEFGLNPADWLLADPTSYRENVVRLLHRDDDEILLKVRILNDGEIDDVELLILGPNAIY